VRRGRRRTSIVEREAIAFVEEGDTSGIEGDSCNPFPSEAFGMAAAGVLVDDDEVE
jgi:hypothetical protein